MNKQAPLLYDGLILPVGLPSGIPKMALLYAGDQYSGFNNNVNHCLPHN